MIMGTKLSLEQKQTLETMRQLLRRQKSDISDAKLLSFLDWLSTHIKDLPLASIYHLDAWQTVGQKLFYLASASDVCASRHLATWGIIMSALTESNAGSASPLSSAAVPQGDAFLHDT